MKTLLFILIALFVVCSCNKQDNEADDEQPGVWLTSFTGNYMDGFIKPSGLKMNYKKTKDDNGAILFELDHDGFECTYQTPEGETDNAKYNEYAKYYGDTTYTGRHNMSEQEIVCAAPLKSINVVADRDFDESHPAGASLNDIFTFKYLAYYSFVKMDIRMVVVMFRLNIPQILSPFFQNSRGLPCSPTICRHCF